MKRSERLERQIEHIHKLLEDEDAIVTWDDRIPDPDNITQPRQIDVTIRRGSLLTLVECRLHKQPQDVTWIEELIGRRESLRADAIIAVSASGFTEGAIKKANAKGIILRTFESLSNDEIKSWGREIGVCLSVYRFIECEFVVTLPSMPSKPIVLSAPDGTQLNLLPLFGMIMDKLEREDVAPGVNIVSAEIQAGLLVSGIMPSHAIFTATVERTKKDLKSASTVGYSAAGEPINSAYAVVRNFDSEAIEIIDSTKELAVVIDLSGAGLSTNEYVRSAEFDFGFIRDVKWFHLIGANEMKFEGPVRTKLYYPETHK